MKATMLFVAMLTTACAAGAQGADQIDVKSVLDKFQSIRPQEADLAIYRLDWLSTLSEARERAAKERRPIFLVVVTNSFGDLFSGHC